MIVFANTHKMGGLNELKKSLSIPVGIAALLSPSPRSAPGVPLSPARRTPGILCRRSGTLRLPATRALFRISTRPCGAGMCILSRIILSFLSRPSRAPGFRFVLSAGRQAVLIRGPSSPVWPRPGPVDRSSFRRLRPSFDPPSLFAHSRSSPKGGGRI